MFFIANFFLKRDINKLRLLTKQRLLRDLDEQNLILKRIREDDTSALIVYGHDTDNIEECIRILKRRIRVDDQYKIISSYFTNDKKRLAMVNSNFLKYLEAINLLYNLSASAAYDSQNLDLGSDPFESLNLIQSKINKNLEIVNPVIKTIETAIQSFDELENIINPKI
jgi:hypothetical protein